MGTGGGGRGRERGGRDELRGEGGDIGVNLVFTDRRSLLAYPHNLRKPLENKNKNKRTKERSKEERKRKMREYLAALVRQTRTKQSQGVD